MSATAGTSVTASVTVSAGLSWDVSGVWNDADGSGAGAGTVTAGAGSSGSGGGPAGRLAERRRGEVTTPEPLVTSVTIVPDGTWFAT
ncbi:hypothetical protein Pth03_31100 [Planotetraspora thailandica]|uniref:Uncharacterized protein n=1 Tax=Planotetraspora thailandica TaxID=487172 RepID=A0A8J3V491_9ACTN|nr:hypothetical protein Pth03_31100 [Planotetraspora thailandica]